MNSAMTALSASEINTYQNQGYLIPELRLPEKRIGELSDAVSQLIEQNPGVRPEHLVSAHIQSASGSNPGVKKGEGIHGHEIFLDLAHDKQLLDVVASILGPDIILWGLHVFCKPPGDGMEVPFHQDGQYWPIQPLANCTLWLAIDDSLRDNGCLRIIPGSHRPQQIFQHDTDPRDKLVLTQKISDAENDRLKKLGVNMEQPVDIELTAGQMSLHDIYMIHGSNRNTSTRRRAGIAIRYMPASSHFNRTMYQPGDSSGFHVDYSQRPIWLVRGKDVSGKNDFQAGH